MERFYHFVKNNLQLTYSEARGFTQLLLICLTALVLYLIPEFFLTGQPKTNPEDIRKLDSLVTLLEKKENKTERHELFLFDPNNISLDSLLLLGFPKQIAERYLNYLATGARFHVKADIKKIYGMPDSLTLRIYPFIDLPDAAQKPTEEQKTGPFDLNTVSVKTLSELEMIDESTARRIVSYRNLLGGFVDLIQLNEVYGISEEAVKGVSGKSYIDPKFQPQMLQINLADKNTLSAHPYISDQLAEDVILFRDINGSIKSETVLAGFKSIDKSKFELLILYLDFQ